MESIKVAELLSSPIFQCATCTKRLSAPIMNVPNVGYVCGRCFQQNPHADAIENTEITSILSKLLLPCCYSKQGCFYQGSLLDTSKHEAVCKYRERRCPFSYIARCPDILLPCVSTHFNTQHADHIRSDNSNRISIDFSLTADFEDFYMLVFNGENYLLRVKLDGEQNHFCFLMYYFNNHENSFSIKHERGNVSYKGGSCRTVPDSFLTAAFHSEDATTNQLLLLRKYFNTDVTTVITLCTPTFLIPNSRMLKCMECPVCNEYMNLEIQQCSKGHSICKMCKERLEECPLCKSGFRSGRNYTLESLSSLVYFPCRNNGCTRYVSGEEIKNHDLQCEFKHYQCPFVIKLNCQWKGLHDKIIDHLLLHHADCTEHNTVVQRSITVDYVNYKYDTICIIFGGHVFKVCVCINTVNKLYLTFGIYGPISAANTFHWETGVYYKNLSNKKFVVGDVCGAYKKTNFKIDVNGYAQEDTICFYHKVTQTYL